MDVEINDLASLGLILDIPPYQLPPEAWTQALNMRAIDGAMEKVKGWEQVFGTPGVAPHFHLPISGPTQAWWLYMSLLKAYVFDGSSHTDITRAAGDYTTANTRDINGTILGGIPILNTGADVPQFWASYSAAQDLQNLTNWTATHRCRVMRALGPHLVAAYITKSGVVSPHMVKWSHPADPGSVPSSWDQTDPAVDAGENDLPDVWSGVIMDMLNLKGQMFIYKEGATWRMRFIGGRFVFAFDSFLETSGILAPRCMALTGDGGRHSVVTQDDWIVHDGTSAFSILDKRWKRYLFNQIDTASYLNSFVFDHPGRGEMRFCYPENGQTQPSRALVWNYRENRMGVFTEEDGVDYRNAAIGTVETADTDTWATGTDTWVDDTGPWSSSDRRKVVLANPDATKFFQMDSTVQRNGVNYISTLQRTGLAVAGRKRNGQWIVDFKMRKLCTRIWPKVIGGPIDIRLGSQDLVDGNVTWEAAQSFDPMTQMYLDFTISGRALCIEFSTTGNVAWRVEGYKLEIFPIGFF